MQPGSPFTKCTTKHNRKRPRRSSTSGHLSVEPLESREVLSTAAAAFEAGKVVESARDPITIAAVHLQVSDQQVTLKERNDVVYFSLGDNVEVVGIEYFVTGAGENADGVIAFEGYLRRSDASSHLGQFDYGDGRFSRPTSGLIQSGHFVHSGLQENWTLDETVNRLSIALVRYHGDDFTAEDRFFLNFQPENVDVRMERGAYGVQGVGREAAFYGRLENRGKQSVSTYSEVNIFLESDLSVPVWVGTFEASVDAGKTTDWLEYTNTNTEDGYDLRWTPSQGGRYIVKIWVDPTNNLKEIDESNNFRSTEFKLK